MMILNRYPDGRLAPCAESLVLPGQVQPMQVEFCEEGRGHPALRRSGRFLPYLHFLHYTHSTNWK